MSVAPAYKTALLAYSLGLRVAPPKQDGSKAPDVTGWKAATSERPDEEQLDRWYVGEGHSGVGIVCGAASRNLEVLDFDAVESYEAFVSMARALEWGDLVDRIEGGYLERSPGGVHWLYYCSEIGGNTKLASRPKRPDEMRHARDTVKTLIETRAEGGYIIIAPTNGSVHETGRPYVLERGSLRTITTLTPDERHDLLGLARTFDQMPESDPRTSYEATRPGAGGGRPGDDFVTRATWDDVLTPHGWKRLYGSGDEQYWRRPGKDRGQSATTNYRGSDLLYVFSSSTEFEPERGYNKFSAYAILGHGGDWKAAASELRRRGYGKQAGATVGRIGMSGTDTAGEVPEIYADEQDLRIVTTEAWDAVVARNTRDPSLFLFGGEMTRVEIQGDERPIARTLTLDHVRYELARTAAWWAMRGPKDARKRVAQMPPLAVCRDVMATPQQPLPVLDRIVGCPVFSSSGTLVSTNGYTPDGRVFVAMPPSLAVPDISEHPSAAVRARARSLIVDELLGDFLFVDDADLAHAVALGLEPFVRSMIHGPMPLHDIEAPTAGTGKGLLAHALLGPSAGASLSYMDAPGDEDEMRKRLLSSLRNSPVAIVMDNLGAHLSSSSLSSVLTVPDYWEERMLGSSVTFRVPVRCSWIVTGNNPSFSEEMARRVIRTRIDASMGDPSERSGFRHDPLMQWVHANRGALIWAYCTLISAWIDDGTHNFKGRIGSYEAWSRVVGGVLESAGISGFLRNQREFVDASSSDRSALQEFVSVWWARYAGQEVGSKDLYEIATQIPGLALGHGGDRAQQTAFGIFVRGVRDRVVAGYVIKRGGKKQRAQQWYLMPEDNSL